MLILKKINNNVALAVGERRDEIVVFGRGIGFPEMPYELEDESKIQRIFVGVDEGVAGVLASISDEVFLAATDIADTAAEALDCKLATSLPFSLADHLQFAVDRGDDSVVVPNPLSHEVAYVYPREHEVGIRGIDIVRARTGVKIPEVEATSIALHIVNAEIDGMGCAQDMDFVMKSTAAIQAIIEIVEAQLGVALDRTSYPYVRFVAHLRFLVRRLMRDRQSETENSSLFRQAARDFPDAYRCAAAINNYFAKTYNWGCSDEELLYLMMHINRLRSS